LLETTLIKTIGAGDPTPESLKWIERFVKEYDIRIAIHNHGPGARYDKVADTLRAVEGRHPFIGACVDTGHCVRSGERPADVIAALGPKMLALGADASSPARLRLSVCIDALFGDVPFEERPAKVKAAGVDAFEFWGWRGRDMNRLARIREELGLQVIGFACDTGGPLVAPGGAKRIMAPLKDALATARKLGCHEIIADLQKNGVTPDELGQAKQSILALIDRSRRTNEYWLTAIGAAQELESVKSSFALYHSRRSAKA